MASTLPTPVNLFLTSALSSRSYVYLCMNAVQVSARHDRGSLKDGSEVGIRCVNASDRDSLTALYDRLSQHSRYQRFFACPAQLPAAWADMLVEVLPERRFGLVAEVLGEPPSVIAIANCTISPDRRWAEVGLLVEDAWQDRGLGGVLCERLISWCEARDVRVFVAYVHWDNERVIGALGRHAVIIDRRLESGVLKFTFTRSLGGWCWVG